MSHIEKIQIISSSEIKKTLYRLSHEILERTPENENIVLLGIQTRGAHLAKRVKKIIKEIDKTELPLGVLDRGQHANGCGQLPGWRWRPHRHA